jgi:hypothetical protein
MPYYLTQSTGHGRYSPFIIEVPFSGEDGTACCHQFYRYLEGEQRRRLSDYRKMPANQRLPSSTVSFRHLVFPWIATGTPMMNGQYVPAQSLSVYVFCLLFILHGFRLVYVMLRYIILGCLCSCQWGETVSQLRPVVNPPDDVWIWISTVEWYWQGKTEELGKTVPMPLFPQRGLARARTPVCALC